MPSSFQKCINSSNTILCQSKQKLLYYLIGKKGIKTLHILKNEMKILTKTKEKQAKKKKIFRVVSNSSASSEGQYLYKNTVFLSLIVCYVVSCTSLGTETLGRGS